jgi:NADH:ubiquinone oxidoreductase subunit F (NADH-binding)
MHPLEKRVLLPQDLKPLNSLSEYKAQGGLQGLAKASEMSGQAIINEVKKSGLRGRGGAGFPTAIKWQTVFDAPDEKKYVVCNMAEGEPGTYKDRYLMGKNPYLLMEGILIIARVIKARQAIIGTKVKFKKTVASLQKVLKEFEDAGVVQPGYIKIVLGPDEYLLGEEKALLEVVDGRDPMPRFFPPYMVGVNISPTERNPAIVNNAESMSHLPHIFSKGADWFRLTGTEDTPGTIMLTLTGDVKKPGMYEVPSGITVRQFLYDLGGGPKDKPIKAVFSGVANRVMTPDQFDLKMDFGSLRGAGVGLGSGGFIVYDESRWMGDVAWMFSHFLAVSSCGQCVPCNLGCRVITEHLLNIREGRGTRDDVEDILVETKRCTNQSRCFLPTQESVLISSIIQKFSNEFYPGKVNGSFNRDIVVPKVEDFDDATGQFTFEESPKEFC